MILLDANLREVGGFAYAPDEIAFAEAIQATLAQPKPIGSQQDVQPWEPKPGTGSTDVADVSWVVPTAQFRAATWVPGTPAHSWQAVAAGGTGIGTKGMLIAAKTLAMTATDLFLDPGHLDAARAELRDAQGAGFVYETLVGDRDPPLAYRASLVGR